MTRQKLWEFPFLTWLQSRRSGAVPAKTTSVTVTAPATGEAATAAVTPSGDVVVAHPQESKLVGTYTSAAGIAMDVYKNPNTGKYDVKCPEYPFYDRTGEYKTLEDAKWYVEEVSMGSSTETAKAATTTSAGVPIVTSVIARTDQAGAGTSMVGKGTTGRYI